MKVPLVSNLCIFKFQSSPIKLELTLNKCCLELSVVPGNMFVISDLTTMAAQIDLREFKELEVALL